MTPLKQAIAGCISVMVFTTALFFISRHFLAEIYCPTEWNSTMNLNWKPYLTDIQKAISINPDNSEYRFRLAGYYMANSYPDPKLRQEFNEKAIASLETSVKLNPAAGESWYALGKSYSMRVYDTDAYADKWLPLAEHCFDMAVFSSPNDDAILVNVAGYWVWRSKTFGQSEYIGRFQQLFQKALSLNPRQWEQAVSRVWEYYPDHAIVADIVAPENESLKNTILKWISVKEKEKRKIPIPDRAPITSEQVGYSYHEIHNSYY
jgi:tetratricopeptide (TPR) repeat protein